MPDELSIAVIGLGMGAARAREIVKTLGVRLAAVVDSNTERADRVAEELGCEKFYDIADILGRDDIDAAHVMTPSGTHADVAVPLAKAGKHILMTKPLEISLDRCDVILDACREGGVELMMDYQFRYSSDARFIRQALADGYMGQPVFGEAMLKWFRPKTYFEGVWAWHGTWAGDGGGSLMNQSIHLIDLLTWVMGPVRWVQGVTAIQMQPIETEDVGMAMLEFASGAVGRILGTTTYVGNDVFRLEVHGTEVGAILDEQGKAQWKFWKDAEKDPPACDDPVPQNAMDDLGQVVRGERPNTVDGATGRAAVELILTIYESSRAEGKRIQLS
jgi:UDP-N-acetyl-2-amino-2-deoxyglucuronate dehydrogenase